MELIGEIGELSARLRDLEDDREARDELFDQIETHVADTDAPATDDDAPPGGARMPDVDQAADPVLDAEAAPVLDMRQLVAWVRENITEVFERRIAQSRSPYWCPQWWLHPEAIARFAAVHRCWLEASASPPGPALVAYFEHVDNQLGVLMGAEGTFSDCAAGKHATAPMQGRWLGQHEPDEDYYLCFEQPPQPSTLDSTVTPTPRAGTGVTTAEAPGGHGRRIGDQHHVTRRIR